MAILSALSAAGYAIEAPHKFRILDRVTKISGSSWTGRVVGFYSTKLTPTGYCVESENEPGSVQIYPEAALRTCDGGANG
ncbi:MAG TPA: DfrB family trimethoprim-resistant dihydrofolate reductase [Mesorhizobium sp.]|uniref:DfrB family trimethoprim-resistant dihydrofolate reductase n=1 Tax=Mesorhizobium sp. TaxID=1871066 RepID=UPI002DDD86FE|nr:DfrB family trimethoprim-resistant dihydrofolate reductase [Mesorhizobium sp.]HEV2507357.1 DfrB family trimethoprim-resistant dihydrofolate reductase [Mesorhizobium sp.]